MAKQVTVIADMIAAFIIPFVLVMVTYIQTVKADLSSADIGNFLSSQTNQESIYIYQDFEKFSALAFYGPGCFKIIDSQSNDLYYGAHLPQFKAWFVSAKEFLQQSLNQQTYVVVPADKLNQFYQNMGSTQFLLVTKNDRLAVVTH